MTYAYTLIAHEFAEMEKLEQAAEMFKKAVAIDPHHYNAWWGLGNLYLRQQEFPNAKYHFEKAVAINPDNVVLQTSLAQAMMELNENTAALEILHRATKMPHGGASASFQKGCVLATLNRTEEAIEELQKAQNLAPREPCVKYQLG